MALPLVHEPFSKPELLRELRSLHEQGTAFWDSFSTLEFFAPLGDAWSPADNVRHLIKSNRPVVRALSLFRPVLLLRFGLTLRSSRSYSRIREIYLTALAGGVTAGRFAPTPEPLPDDLEAARRALMARRGAIAAALEAALGSWSEGSLDRHRLPHPALGSLTVREMLFFTLYHNLHHVQNVAGRAAGKIP